MRRFDPATFWKGIRFDEMRRLALAYKLRVCEENYLRKRILEVPCAAEFDERATYFLDTMAKDVRAYFQERCPDDECFEGIIMDEERQAEHRAIWEAIRREHPAPRVIEAGQRSVGANQRQILQ